MANETVTPEQIAWGNEYLRIMGEESEGRENQYGEGFSESFRKDDLPKKFRDRLGQKKAKMFTATEWDQLATPPKPADYDSPQKRAEIAQKLNRYGELRTLGDASYAAAKKRNTLRDAKSWPCDIGPPEGPVAQTNATAKQAELEREFKGHDQKIKEIREGGQACMALIDAPENNPERGKVSKLLKELEGIDKELGGGKPTAENAAKKGKKLHELQQTLFEWNNRRAQQKMPPSSEAVGLADLLQNVHLQLTEDVVKNKWPMPIPNEESLSAEEKQKIQETWANLRDDGGKLPGQQVGKLLIAPTKLQGYSEGDMEQFRTETLSNFMRLMTSEAGQHIVDRINSGKFPVTLLPGDEAKCETYRGADRDVAGNKGAGCRSEVRMVPGEKDSDKAMNTADGNVLFSPRFIAMGHEFIHAMHNSSGSGRGDMPMPEGLDKKWNNMEEFHTIFAGNTSEKTLRDQYGMSAVRHGHLASNPDATIAGALTAELEAAAELRAADEHAAFKQQAAAGRQECDALRQGACASYPGVETELNDLVQRLFDPSTAASEWSDARTKLEGLSARITAEASQAMKVQQRNSPAIKAFQAMQKLTESVKKLSQKPAATNEPTTANGTGVEETLTRRGWDAKELGNRMRLALYKDESVLGPLPEGWDANQLTLEQIKAIRLDNLAPKLRALGWTPFDLTDVARLKEVIATEEHHPNSPMHRRYKKLGGDDALYALKGLGINVTFDPQSWPTRVTALEQGTTLLQASAATASGPLQALVQSKGQAPVTPKDAAKAWRAAKERYETANDFAFNQRATDYFGQLLNVEVEDFVHKMGEMQGAAEGNDYWRAYELWSEVDAAMKKASGTTT